MITRVELENFAGGTGVFDFGQITTLMGKNGVGKSRFKNAVTFAIAGTDAYGTRAPVHLISSDKDACKVAIHTSKGAVISRSLTRAKNGTLKLIQGDLATDLTQGQLEELIAPGDVFRSVFLPGYFLSSAMTPERRRKTLSEVLPPVDRIALLSELFGEEITPEWVTAFGLDSDKRADLIASNIATSRRKLEKALSEAEGRIKELQAMPPPGEEPVPTIAGAKLKRTRELRKLWQDYQHRYRMWESAQFRFERVADDNAKRQARKAELEKEYEIARNDGAPVPPVPRELLKRREELIFEPLPPAPSAMHLPDSEACPTCGQTVGKKHRERVAADNAATRDAYERACAEVTARNEAIKAELAQLNAQIAAEEKRVQEGITYNQQVEFKQRRLKAEIDAVVMEVAEDPGQKPLPPTEEVPSEGEEASLEAEQKEYERRKALYDHAVAQYAGAAQRIGELGNECASLRQRVERAQRLEQCVKALPQEELRRQADALAMKDYVLDLEGNVDLYHKDGRPLGILSNGEAMKACNALSIKLNSLMKRKINMIFVDNAEAIDDPGINELADDGRQVFLAYMDKNYDTLQIG